MSEINRYNKAKAYLEEQAKENDWKYFSIVHDSYEFDNGLLLIGYADEASMRCLSSNPIELGHICVNIDSF